MKCYKCQFCKNPYGVLFYHCLQNNAILKDKHVLEVNGLEGSFTYEIRDKNEKL